MKRNAIVISVFALVILCCVLGVIWYDRSSRRPDSIRESRVSQLPDEVETVRRRIAQIQRETVRAGKQLQRGENFRIRFRIMLS